MFDCMVVIKLGIRETLMQVVYDYHCLKYAAMVEIELSVGHRYLITSIPRRATAVYWSAPKTLIQQ